MTKLKLNSTWKKDDKPREAKEDPPIVKYLASQVDFVGLFSLNT